MIMNTTQSMIQALGSPDGTQRRHAALALGAQPDASVVGPLVERIRVEPDSCVREDLTWAIVQHADDAEQALTDLLGSEEPGDRRTAAHVLSKVANPEHFDRIRPLVADEHPDVAIKAYRAAANTGGDAAVQALATRIGDGDLLQRDALSNAFAKIGAASTGALVAALSSERVETREHAAEALGHLGEDAAGAVDALEAAAGDADASVRLTAAASLGQLGEGAAAALGRLAASGDPVVAQIAASYLA